MAWEPVKLILIITTKADEVSKKIDQISGRGPQQSGRSEPIQKRKRMCCSVPAPALQAYSVRSAAHEVDPDAFVMLTETSEVFGEGFMDTRK